MVEAVERLRKLSTGSEDLDSILGGGIPEYSVTLIAGEPGSGKTIFALQMMFHFAREGKKGIYFTTLSEPAMKLIRYMQLFDFFEKDMLDDRLVIADLGTTIRREGPERALQEAVERVEKEAPDIVVIDSFKAIHDLLGDPVVGRRTVYDLAVQMSAWGATTFLVGEYTKQEMEHLPESAIVDGIIYLGLRPRDLIAEREMEVLKMRGAAYVTGKHFFVIEGNGLRFYPRVRAPDGRGLVLDYRKGHRLKTGVEGLDEMLGGGLPEGTTTLVEGGTGTGKTLLALHFLVEGCREGKPAILFTLEETPEQLRAVAKGFDWDLQEFEKKGLLVIDYWSPVELSTDLYLNNVRKRVEEVGARRVALDSLTSLKMGVVPERRFRELVYALSKHINSAGAKLLMTIESPGLWGPNILSGQGTSSLADQVILLRYVDVGPVLKRGITVLKARGIAHERTLRQYLIDRDGFSVRRPFKVTRGVYYRDNSHRLSSDEEE